MYVQLYKMASLQSAPLDFVHRVMVCTIFQDCVDQLGILGGIIPIYAAKPSALDNVSKLVGCK